MQQTRTWAAAGVLAVLLGGHTNAGPIQLVNTYSQNFDSLAGSPGGGSVGWVDDGTIPGWFANRTSYGTNNGTATTGGLYSYGLDGDADRALGSMPSNATSSIRFGAQFQNKTTGIIQGLTITYTNEQWRDANTTAQVLDFFLGTDATALGSSGYTPYYKLRAFGPQHANAGALNGNDAANRHVVTYTITNLHIGEDETFWIRWHDFNSNGADHGLAIDDFTITAHPSPEPSTLVLGACGVLGGLGWMWRRRREFK